MDQPKRSRGRPPKRGEKATVRVGFFLYPQEAETFFRWAEQEDVSLVDAFRKLLTLATDAPTERVAA